MYSWCRILLIHKIKCTRLEIATSTECVALALAYMPNSIVIRLIYVCSQHAQTHTHEPRLSAGSDMRAHQHFVII